MSEEEKKKEEKKKNEKPISLSVKLHEFSDLGAQALAIQQKLSNSGVIQAALKAQEMMNSYSKMLGTLEIATTLSNVAKAHKALMDSLYVPATQIARLNEQMRQIADYSVRVSKMVETSISPSILEKELATIPSRNNTLVRSLLREIELLETNLAAKEKQIAAKDAEIEQLRALLEEKRKELQKQYVS